MKSHNGKMIVKMSEFIGMAKPNCLVREQATMWGCWGFFWWGDWKPYIDFLLKEEGNSDDL